MDDMTSLDMGDLLALRNHLEYDHYPPVDSAWVPFAVQAIEHAASEDWDAVIANCPNGKDMTAEEIVTGLHLSFFVDRSVEIIDEYE